MRTLVCILFACAVSSAWASFKCVDANGATHIGDAPPPACANVIMYEIGPSGAVVRRIEPTGNAAAGAASAASAHEAEKAAAAAKRRDRALLDSYTSAQEIDRARDRNVEMLRARIESTDLRMRQLKQNDPEQQSLAASKARLQKELEETQGRFDADKARWIELRAGR